MTPPDKIPEPVSPPQPHQFSPGSTLVTPLSRQGVGPGLIVLVPEAASGIFVKNGIPSPLMKWAEEGYSVVEITNQARANGTNPLDAAVKELDRCEKCHPKGEVGLVCYDLSLWNHVASSARSSKLAAAIAYTSAESLNDLPSCEEPTLIHVAGKGSKPYGSNSERTLYFYAEQTSPQFATPSKGGFHYASEAVAHTRNLTFLKKHMGGPFFDLEAIWEEHTYYEFENRSVENTMNTMVQEPYVNHVPTLAGGIGRKHLSDFYRDHFIFSNPQDAQLELISRTTGIDRVVDEFIYKCTHDRMVDWLLPGVPPTNRYLEIPMMAVVNIRGDRLYHEHIHWDHATALRQAGLLPECIPYSGEGPVFSAGYGNTSMELRLPIAGNDGAKKMRDKNSVPSNEMFGFGVRKLS